MTNPEYGYRDLVDRHTGKTNVAAFAYLLAAAIEAETNLAICVKAERLAPRLHLHQLRGWRAEQAAEVGNNLTAAERAEIARVEREHLNNLVAAMRDARTEAEKQLAAEAA